MSGDVVEHRMLQAQPAGHPVRAWFNTLAAVAVLGAGLVAPAQVHADAGSFTLLHSFGFPDGIIIYGGLVQGPDGRLYGTVPTGVTQAGGGAIYSITTDGAFSILDPNTDFSFAPEAQLSVGADGRLYGTGEECCGTYGTVFSAGTDGTPQILHTFQPAEGGIEWNGVIRAGDGTLYGTADLEGGNGLGSVYKIDGNGFTQLHSFTGGLDGAHPTGMPIQASDGSIYATAGGAGAGSGGTLFRIAPDGTFSVFAAFNQGNLIGAGPFAGVMQGHDGALYGTTCVGGAYGNGTIYRINLFGEAVTLHSFATNEGFCPAIGALAEGPDGRLYGTVQGGSPDGTRNANGNVFQLGLDGTLTILHWFTGATTDGGNPFGGVIMASDGNLYGTTMYGGASGSGTIYKVTPPKAAPAVRVNIDPGTIHLGGSTTLSWMSSDISACTASGAWTGRRGPKGSVTITPRKRGSFTFALTCKGPDGAAQAGATLTVTR